MKFYSLNEFTLVVGALSIEDDVGEIGIEPFGERYKGKPGTDGSLTIVEDKGADNHYVTIKTPGTSSTNALLSALYNVQRLSAGGVAGVVPFACNDRQGTSSLVSGAALLTGWPKRSLSREEPGDVEWKFIVEQPERFEGGN
jgi:hypothetical protein